MVALHSSDPATVFLSIQARVPGFTPTDLEQALYEDRSLVRILGMRRTMWVVARDLAPVLAVEVTLANGPGYLLGEDIEHVAPPGPWVALLPSLDPTTMGWKERGWYLGDHYPVLFDRNGNAGPTVGGRARRGWLGAAQERRDCLRVDRRRRERSVDID